MGEHQSQKRGARSEAQKMDDAREGYDAARSTSRQDGALGKQTKQKQSDQDAALNREQKRAHQER